MKTVEFEYGQGTMTAQLPDSTDIFVPGETVKDPPCIGEEKLVEAHDEQIPGSGGDQPLLDA